LYYTRDLEEDISFGFVLLKKSFYFPFISRMQKVLVVEISVGLFEKKSTVQTFLSCDPQHFYLHLPQPTPLEKGLALQETLDY
jgi:hypothetical protein